MAHLDALLALLAGEVPPRPPWTADLSYWIRGEEAAGRADPSWETEEGYLRLHAELGLMPYYDYRRFWAGEAVYDNTVVQRTSREGNRRRQVIETPAGTLTRESAWLPESCCEGVTRHPVQSEAELDVLLYLLEHRTLEPRNLDEYPARRRLWERYDGLPCLGLPRSPLPALCYEWTGVEPLVYLLIDCEAKVEEALQRLEAQAEPILEAVCDLAPPLVHMPDNLTSENFTSFYDRHMGPRYRRRLARLHAVGTKAAVHLDGTVAGLLPKLCADGFDAVEALTPQPAGDLAAAAMRSLAKGSGTILWGGVPGALFSPPWTEEQLHDHLASVLAAWRGRPFVVGVADQVPPDGRIDFCRRIGEWLAA